MIGHDGRVVGNGSRWTDGAGAVAVVGVVAGRVAHPLRPTKPGEVQIPTMNAAR